MVLTDTQAALLLLLLFVTMQNTAGRRRRFAAPKKKALPLAAADKDALFFFLRSRVEKKGKNFKCVAPPSSHANPKRPGGRIGHIPLR